MINRTIPEELKYLNASGEGAMKCVIVISKWSFAVSVNAALHPSRIHAVNQRPDFETGELRREKRTACSNRNLFPQWSSEVCNHLPFVGGYL
jgi:hypothetical protein